MGLSINIWAIKSMDHYIVRVHLTIPSLASNLHYTIFTTFFYVYYFYFQFPVLFSLAKHFDQRREPISSSSYGDRLYAASTASSSPLRPSPPRPKPSSMTRSPAPSSIASSRLPSLPTEAAVGRTGRARSAPLQELLDDVQDLDHVDGPLHQWTVRIRGLNEWRWAH